MAGLLSDMFDPGIFDPQTYLQQTYPQLGLLARARQSLATMPATLIGNTFPNEGNDQLPEAASSTIGQIPSNADIPETSLLGRLSKGLSDNSTTLMALGAGFAGAPSIGTGISRALGAAIPASQADIKQGQLNATINALTKKGLSPEMAQAAAGNPAILQQLLGQMFGAKALQHVTVKDSLGNEIPMAFDPTTGKYSQASVGGAQLGGTAAASSMPVNIDPKTGRDEEFLKSLSPIEKSAVEGILNGDINAQGRNMQKFLPYAARAEPGFSQQTYQTRLDTAKDFTSKGKSGMNIKSLETVGGHLDKMMKLFPEMGNSPIPMANWVKNHVKTAFGNDAVTNFDTNATGVANELGTVFRSYGMSDSEVKSWRDRISSAASPQQFKGAMTTLLDMLKTRKEVIAEQYKSGLRQDLPADRFQKLDHAIAQVEKILGGSEASAGTPAQGALKPGSYNWTPNGLVPQ